MAGFVHQWGWRVKCHVQGSNILHTISLKANQPVHFVECVCRFYNWSIMIKSSLNSSAQHEESLLAKQRVEPMKREETWIVWVTLCVDDNSGFSYEIPSKTQMTQTQGNESHDSQICGLETCWTNTWLWLCLRLHDFDWRQMTRKHLTF